MFGPIVFNMLDKAEDHIHVLSDAEYIELKNRVQDMIADEDKRRGIYEQ